MSTELKATEAFDREYTLAELLPADEADRFISSLEDGGKLAVAILDEDGRPIYASGRLSAVSREALKGGAGSAMTRINSPNRPDGPRLRTCPIRHEMDSIGHVVVEYPDDRESGALTPGECCRIIGRSLEQIVYAGYRCRLTSGIHTQVVEENYRQLLSRNRALEASERKYRELAAGLEKEVEKKAEAIRLSQAQLMQSEKLAAIGQLAAGVAHEINNPMGFISSNLAALGEYGRDLSRLLRRYAGVARWLNDNRQCMAGVPALEDLVAQVNESAADIDAAFLLEDMPGLIEESLEGAGRITKIVADLKDFAHPDVERAEWADINANIDATLNILGREIKQRAVVKREFGDLPRVLCRHRQINQVFMNILVNAVQAMEKKGRIVVRTRRDERHVAVEIEDDGPGISPEHLKRVFDPFFTTRPVGLGTGLGLNLSHNIVKTHGGRIDVTSEPGKGSLFRVLLPVEPVIETNGR